MADNQQKPNENPQGQRKGGAETIKEILGGGKQETAKATEIIAEKTGVKKETTKDAAEYHREMLQAEVVPDKETPAEIEKLDVNGTLESKEQKESFNMLLAVTTTTLLAVLYDQGVKKEDLKTFENVRNIGGPALAKLNPAERVSLKKLQEIASKPGSPLYKALKEKTWDRMVDRSYEIYQGAKKTLDHLNGQGQQPAEGTEGEKKPTGFFGKILNVAKEHPVLFAGGVALGLYGVYKIFKHFTSSDSDKGSNEPGFIDKILGDKWGKRLKWTLGLGLGTFALGRLLGSEDIGKWMKDKLGINITGNRLSQFVVLLSDAIATFSLTKLIEAFKVLFAGPDEHFEMHRIMAEKISKETGINVTPETLKSIGNVKYDEFMSKAGEGKGIISGLVGMLGKIPLLGGAIQSLVGGFVGGGENVEEEAALRKYFEAHQEEIGHMKNVTTTVDDVLMNLGGGEKPAPPPEATALDPIIGKLDTPEKKAMAKEIQADMGRLIPETDIITIITNCKKVGADTKKLEELLAERKQAFAELKLAMENNAEPQEMATKADKLFEVNNRLGEERNRMMVELMKRRGWTEVEVLAITHLPKAIQWFMQPAYKREYGKYLMAKYLKAPFALGKKAVDLARGVGKDGLIGREFKENATVAEIDEDLSRTKAERIQAENDQAAFESAKVNAPDNDIAKNNVEHNKKKIDLLKKDEEIHTKRKALASSEEKLNRLRSPNAGPSTEITLAEKDVMDNKSMLRSLTQERVVLQGDFLTKDIIKQRLDFAEAFGEKGKTGKLTKGYIDQMDQMQEAIGTHRKQIDREIASRMKEAEEVQKAGKDVKPLVREITGLQEARVRLDLGGFNAYQDLAKSWTKQWEIRKVLRGETSAEAKALKDVEKNKLQKLWYNMMTGRQEGTEGISRGMFKTLKGKMYFYGAFIAAGSAINLMDKQQGEDWSKSIEQAAVDTLPFVSTYSDFYSAIEGQELVTGRKLEGKDQIFRALFGVGSALCDVTEFAGAMMRLRAAYGTMKEAKAIGKSVELDKLMRAMGAEGKDSVQALREMSQTGHWINKVAMGGALGLAGYALIYKPVASMELNPETIAILGDQVQDLDIEPPKIDHPMSAAT